MQFSFASESVNQSALTFSITVTLSAAAAQDVSVPFALGGTAVSGTDYSGVTSSPLTIPAGHTSATISGTLLADPGPNKTLTFTLNAPTNTTLGAATVNTLSITEAIAPVGPIVTDVPLFAWNVPVGGVSEELAVVDLATGQLLIVPNLSGTSYQLPTGQALRVGDPCIWYIGAVSGTGAIAWSSGTRFQVVPLAGPKPIAPATPLVPGVGYDTPTFTWSSVPDVVQYVLYLENTTTGTTTVYDPHIRGTSFTPSQPLLAGQSYVWAVGAAGTLGDAGPVFWGGAAALSVHASAAPTAQNLSGPIAAVTSGYDTPTFTWSSVPYAVNYNLVVEDAATRAVVVDDTTLTGTTYAPGPVLLAGHSYTWLIGAEAAAGVLGQVSWSVPAAFSLAPLACASNLATTFSGSTPTLSWSSVPAAVSYRLMVVDAFTGALVMDSSSLTIPSFTITGGLTSGHRYTWYVAALGAAGAAGPDFWGSPANFIAP